MKTKLAFNAVLTIIAAFILTTCSEYLDYDYGGDEIPADLKNVTIGTLKQFTTATIASSGGSLTVTDPGSKIDGLKITIPGNAFTSAQTITVSVADITSHQLGDNFKPISPLININCPGGYANELMSVTIPVTIPAGSIAIGFFLDAETGKLEGIPVAEATNNSITLLTRHFLSGDMLRTGAPNLKSGTGVLKTGANIIITSLAESMLRGLTSISSGYKPGTDDWEFVNRGSFIAPGGHCAGQTFTSMWYYYEMKAAEGDLFEKFSYLAGYDKDNARGYRFSSVVQKDLDYGGTLNHFLRVNVDLNPETDKLKMYTIAGAMLVTGEPQAIVIYRIKDHKPDGSPIYGGHALICYAVSINAGKLSIADPNKPGLEQEITYVNDKFQPYIAMANAEAASDPYPFISYSAKTAHIEWNKIGQRYAELLNFTIGTVDPNKFPEYHIMVKGKVDRELTDNFTIDSDTLRTEVELPDAFMAFEVDGKRVVRHVMVNERGQTINTWDGVGSYTILKPGVNIIGFDIYAKKEGAVDKAGNLRNLFVDFKWYRINYIPLKITPDPLEGEPDVECEMVAETQGFAPADAKYVWSFGDGSDQITVVGDSIAKHTYNYVRKFPVSVELYDANNNLLSKASSIADIQFRDHTTSFNFRRISPISGIAQEPKPRLDVTIHGTAQGAGENIILGIDTLTSDNTELLIRIINSKKSGIIKVDFTFQGTLNPIKSITTFGSGKDKTTRVNTFDLTTIGYYYRLPTDSPFDPDRAGSSGTYEGLVADQGNNPIIYLLLACGYRTEVFDYEGKLISTDNRLYYDAWFVGQIIFAVQ